MSLRAETPADTLYLLGMGHFHPETVLDNAFFESLDIGTDDAWILERVGIRTRRTVLSLDYIKTTRNADPRAAAEASSHSNAQTGALAAKMALERAGITAGQIGLVIAGGCSPQHSIPAEACLIAAELGIEAPAFDLNSACSSFAAQVHFLRNQRPETLPDYILVVNAENTTRTIDYNDRSSAVLWGDGTSAAVLSPRHPGALAVRYSTLHSDPSGWNKVVIPPAGHFSQNGPAVQGFAIRKSGDTLKELRENGPSEVHYIGHQANLLMLQAVCERAGIAPDKHRFNVDRFGNCGASGAPGVLSQNWGQFPSGDTIALVVVGSGLTWGGLSLAVL